MKIFEVWSKRSEYVILKCDKEDCGHIFRFIPDQKVFGNEIKNAKCQKCERLIPIKDCSLDHDPLNFPIDGILLRREIVNGKIVKEYPLEKGEIGNLDFSSADQL